MTNRPRIATFAAALLILLVAGVPTCSKSTKPAARVLDSGNIGVGGAPFRHVFASFGSFPYHGANHPSMRGTVTVVASPSEGPVAWEVMIDDFNFNSSSLPVVKGDTVIWTNNGPSIHTVTSD